MQIRVYNSDGQLVDRLTVEEAGLGGKPNRELIRQAVLAYEANQRVGTACTKRRGEVARSGHKPWRQKHTGRSRQGDRASPVWVGGGVAHGPRPRDYRQKMNRKAKARALQSAFLAKALDGEVIALDRLELREPRTREMAAVLRNLGVAGTCLVVVEEHEPVLWRCCRNIQGSAMSPWRELTVYELIRAERVIFVLGALRRFLAAVRDAPEAAPALAESSE
jgi:large subunit ribosomal protein L4